MKRINGFLSIADFSRETLSGVLSDAVTLKKKKFSQVLKGKSVGLIFQKPSTRTAVSFAVGVSQLGGTPLVLNADVLQIKRGESPRDTARVLSRYLDAIVIRANHHADVEEMARYASIPVINGLTDVEHPCQVLADLLTIMEHKKLRRAVDLRRIKVAYLGDGNNVAHSLMLAAAMFDMELTLACPRQYQPAPSIWKEVHKLGSKAKITVTENVMTAVKNADALYTDVWTSMGQEAESQRRRQILAPFQLNAKVMKAAKPGALAMHCLPAHRGEEITEDVLEGSQSVIFDQAENRLHVQKAVLKHLLAGR